MYKFEPIDVAQRQQVIALTHIYIKRAGEIFNRDFDLIPVNFDLSGRTAGMYKSSAESRWIRYNPYIFSKYYEQNIDVTIPHEVAHYVVDNLYGHGRRSLFSSQRIRPHGEEWKNVMREFGADASPTFSFNLEGLPVRKYRQYLYACGCREHQLGSRRHMRVSRKQTQYRCSFCGEELKPSV